MSTLAQHHRFAHIPGPVVTIIMDGVGHSPQQTGNAVRQAHTPNLDRLWERYPNTLLKAHGTAVGMPSDSDMGNSEVGHNAIGSGQVYAQGAALVNRAISDGSLTAGEDWQAIVGNCLEHGSTLHFIGLFSDGNVHSHLDHLEALIGLAKQAGIHRVRVHALLDGRDVGETSALDYLEPAEQRYAELSQDDFDVRIASGGGRMQITMDRYESNWDMVAAGWRTHVHGEGEAFPSASAAVKALRERHPGVIDQDLPPFVVSADSTPVGPIEDGDSVVFFNFRGDRAIEISRAFEEDEFTIFDRGRRPRVVYAGMLEYDGDLHIPKRYLVPPPRITNCMGEYLAATGVAQLAIAETQKYGHVTYFWNGNRSGKFDPELEEYIEIPSDRVPFEQRPWMKAAEVTDALIERLRSNAYRSVRVNYANGDMVGHTGHLAATRIAIEAVDLALGRLLPVIDQLGGVALITADHGNAEAMLDIDKRTGEPKVSAAGQLVKKTSHTLNPVPFILYDNQSQGHLRFKSGEFGISHIAATMVELLGYEPPDCWQESLLTLA